MPNAGYHHATHATVDPCPEYWTRTHVWKKEPTHTHTLTHKRFTHTYIYIIYIILIKYFVLNQHLKQAGRPTACRPTDQPQAAVDRPQAALLPYIYIYILQYSAKARHARQTRSWAFQDSARESLSKVGASRGPRCGRRARRKRRAKNLGLVAPAGPRFRAAQIARRTFPFAI